MSRLVRTILNLPGRLTHVAWDVDETLVRYGLDVDTDLLQAIEDPNQLMEALAKLKARGIENVVVSRNGQFAEPGGRREAEFLALGFDRVLHGYGVCTNQHKVHQLPPKTTLLIDDNRTECRRVVDAGASALWVSGPVLCDRTTVYYYKRRGRRALKC